MSHSVDREDDHSPESEITTVVVRAYNVLKCRTLPFLPKWANPSYTRTKQRIDATLASNSILLPKRVAELKSRFEFITDILPHDLLDEVSPGTYHYGQTLRFDFDAEALEKDAVATARSLTQQLTDTDRIEIIN